MKQVYDLSSLEWSLSGWRPNFWVNAVSMETNMELFGEFPAMVTTVPGSVQRTLREHELLPDWNVKFNSRQCEWVENRHWIYQTQLPADWAAQPGRKILHCEGLDYRGVVLVNGQRVGEFCNTFTPHRFDLTPYLRDDAPSRLNIIFTEIPRDLGQVGYTSRIGEWKARFNYVWDWTPRLVQVGIWEQVRLEILPADALESMTAYTDYNVRTGLGAVTVQAHCALEAGTQVEVALEGAQGEVVRQRFPAQAEFSATIDGIATEAWHPNGNGAQPRYTLHCRLLDAEGAVLDAESRQVGFKQVVWKPCLNAPVDAEPWLCEINGVDTFLQGVNWTPIRPFFADVTEEDYRQRLQLYKEMGCNILRVWGGAVLEREWFYDLCDEYGLLVWQEFPMSSSGLDNWPPEDPAIIASMQPIAESYITRRQYHASLLMWCGGNELQGANDGGKVGIGKPAGRQHPMLAMLQRTVERLDPTRRFIPTSSSGPCFTAEVENFGKGIHHDVHGPWSTHGPLDEWKQYWDTEDSLFRSETGMPGSSPAELIRQYGEEYALPGNKENPFWMYTGGWWLQWEDYLSAGGDAEDLDAYVAWSQARQAEALAYAAQATKSRFPACGGLILWMGHDCYPCTMNTAIIDYLGHPKPAVAAVGEVFRVKVQVAKS